MFISEKNITKQQLLSLLGHFNFAMRVIPQGRSFISRLLDLASSVPNLQDQVTLDDGCRSDLKFWSRLLEKWNGVHFFMTTSCTRPTPFSFLRMQLHPQVLGGSFKASGSPATGLPSFLSMDFPLLFMRSSPSQ